jgi:GR25 family glycosyltransferase involved in LPS biosynthesis
MDSYIISLQYPQSLINSIIYFKLNPILIDGIRGSNLSDDEIKSNINSNIFSLINPKSSIGCAMSHLKAWKHFMYKNSNPFAMFLEDDAIIEPNFIDNLNLVLNNTPEDFDILYLGCFFCDKQYNEVAKYVNNIFGKYKEEVILNDYIKIPQFFLATHSYILSKKGANKLIEIFDKNVYYHLDLMILQEFYKNKLEIYCVRKRLIYQTSSSCISESENVSSNHPILIDNILKSYEADKYVSLNYFKNLSISRIGNININLMSILFLFIGLVLLLFNIDIKVLSLVYILISIIDIYKLKNMNLFFINGLLFLLPTFLKNRLNIKLVE